MYRQLPGSAVHHPLCVDGRSSWRHCLEGGQLQSSLIFESNNPKKRRTTHLLPLFRVYFWAMIMFSKWALFEIFSIFVQKCIFFFENPAYIFSEKQNYRFAQRFVPPIWIIDLNNFFLISNWIIDLKIFSPSADKFSAKSNFYFLYNSLVLLIVVVRYILFLHNLTFSGRHPSK